MDPEALLRVIRATALSLAVIGCGGEASHGIPAATGGAASGAGGAAPGAGGASPSGAAGGSISGGAGGSQTGSGGVPGAGGSTTVGGSPSAGSGGATSQGAGGSAGAAGAPVACNPADKKPEPKVVDLATLNDPNITQPIQPTKGPYAVVVESDPGLPTHTVYRPEKLGAVKNPIVVWANGGCSKNGTYFAKFLLEIASHGFVIVSDGTPNGSGTGPLTTEGGPQIKAMDWIVAENERPCSQYYRKLEVTKIAAMGQSCGGLMTFGASGDPRLTTVVIWNSGMFQRDQMIYAGLHTPMAFIIGGPNDVAYPQAEADFMAITTVPIFYGNLGVGHFGTYGQANGGEFAQVGIGWLKWQLMGDTTTEAKGMFSGPDCLLCKDADWTINKKMMD